VRRTCPRRARLGAIGGGLALIGAALSLADWGGELVKVEMGALSTTYHDAMVALLDRFDSSSTHRGTPADIRHGVPARHDPARHRPVPRPSR
jgi:hypothetical protein